MIAPIGWGMMKIANNAALAAVRHLIQAENAIASNDRSVNAPRLSVKTAPAIQRLSIIHSPPARYDCRRNKSKPGTQVKAERRISNTDIFPTIYSNRENGRERYRGKALLERSREIKTGPMITVKMKAREV